MCVCVCPCVCVKVVHGRAKRFLRGCGVLVLDRLGQSFARQLARQSGAQLISTPFASVCHDQLGRLSRVSHEIVSRKSYLSLEGGPRPVQTLVLCAVTEEAGAELRQATAAAYRVALRAMRERAALAGAGAWQGHLADHVTDWGRRRAGQLCERAGCARSDVTTVADCLADGLRRVARLVRRPEMTSSSSSPEVTSLLERQPEVLDLASSCVGGLETAVLMTQSLLKLQFCSAVAS